MEEEKKVRGGPMLVVPLTWAGSGQICYVSVGDSVDDVSTEDQAVWTKARAVVTSRATGTQVMVRETPDEVRAKFAAVSR